MYKADDLREETEKIVLRRAQETAWIGRSWSLELAKADARGGRQARPPATWKSKTKETRPSDRRSI